MSNFAFAAVIGPSPIHWVSPYMPLFHNFTGRFMSNYPAFVKALDLSKLMIDIIANLKFCFIHRTAGLHPQPPVTYH